MNTVVKIFFQTLFRYLGLLLIVAISSATGFVSIVYNINSCTWFQRNFSVLFIVVIGIVVLTQFLAHKHISGDNHCAKRKAIRNGVLILLSWLIAMNVASVLLGTYNRGRQHKTIQDMELLRDCLSSYKRINGAYPITDSIVELQSALSCRNVFPKMDPWGYPYRFHSSHDGYTIVSTTKCGRSECSDLNDYKAGATTNFEDDIVMVNGVFYRFPEGMLQKSQQ